ncbi:non-ribosomal peptide synthetase [Pseudomonas putida]|uniref:non-ribosomal peptide synthetase n=1 Tax=Pseudomonas putida TaxID=303 RepID=UPI002DB833A2|nr:non-ribosomal peptide synthetase [Pseudomonas putida]WRW01731.1 amino acid adenylation domain-containing protein [Pseudomonas putida]
MFERLMLDCRLRGIDVTVDGQDLKITGATADAVDQQLLAKLEADKPEVVAWLQAHPDHFACRPLTDNEQALWFLHQMEAGANAYNIAYAARLKAQVIDSDLPSRLDAAWRTVQARHPQICSPYAEQDGQVVQLDHQAQPRSLQLQEVSGMDDEALRQHILQASDAPLAVHDGELSRAVLWRNEHNGQIECTLLLVIHHIAADLSTFYLLLGELFDELEGVPLAEVDPHAYRRWCAELHRRAERDEGVELEWWKSELEGIAPLDLPTDFPHGSHQDFRGGELNFRLDPRLAERLRGLTRQLGVTPYAYWFSLFQYWLGTLSGQNDFVVGTPAGWRLKRAQAALPGYLVNPLPMRCRLDADLSSSAWAQQVAQHAKDTFKHRHYPFSRLLQHLELPRQAGRAPLFQHMFTLNKERAAPFEARVERLLSEQRGAAHELNLVIIDDEEGFLARWRYSLALYRRETVERYAALFQNLLQAALEQPDLPLKRLDWLGDQQARLRGEHLALPFSGAWEAFAAQSRLRPEALALEDQAGVLTYAALARAVIAQGQCLAASVGQPAGRIALCLPRSRELIVNMLACWQAGAAYIALDPHWPQSRLEAICADAGPVAWVGEGERPHWLPASVDWYCASERAPDSSAALRETTPEDAVAYVVYTSGTSGQPKGVQVSHGNLLHYVIGVLARLSLDADASLASLASCATDLGHTALFGALLSGRRLRLLDEALAFDAEGLANTLQQRPVDLLKIVPSHLNALLVASDPQRLLPRQCLVTGGEALSPELVERLRALRPGLRIVNHYGPSETTVGVLTREITDNAAISLGQPLPNVEVSVRDSAGRVLPVGVNGELWVAGPTVASGYLNAPDADHARFTGEGYRTGDRVRIDGHGQVLFLGRIDEQVKIRGYRVEPAEVAAQLRALDGVSDARVLNIPAPPAGNRLVAFLVAAEPALAAIQQGLKARLPDYMQPAQWHCVDAFDLLANGKVDLGALRRLAAQAASQVSTAALGAVTPAASASPVEQCLLEIASDILARPDLALHDNFFAVGGDSILSLQIIARAKQQGLQLTPKQIFEHPTVSGWATCAVDLSRQAATPVVREVLPENAFALTPIQRWFFEQQPDATTHWNQSLLLALDSPLEPARLRRALAVLLQRHASLRLVFDKEGQHYQPYTAQMAEDVLKTVFQPLDDRLLQELQQGFQLERAPLIRFVWCEPSRQLLCTAHHLIVDSVSWQLLLQELEALYLHGEQQALAPVSASFAQWSQALQEHAATPVLNEQVDYWREQLGHEVETPVADNRYGESRTVEMQLSPASTQALLGDCHQAYGTQVPDLLMAALGQVLGNWLGRERITVELESHGRSAWETAPELATSVGWHTSRYPLALPCVDGAEQAIVAAKETLRRVPEQGIGYGLLRQNPEHALGTARLLSFNYLGRVDQWLAASSLWRLAQPLCPGMRGADSHRSHWLDINALVLDGCLHLEWRYSPPVHSPALINSLAQQFVQRLDALLEHCRDPQAGRATAADFVDSGLSDDEFLDLLEQL